MAENSTQSVAVNTAGTIGLMLFEGSEGQTVTIAANNSSFGSCNLLLIDPMGTQISNIGCTGSNNSLGPVTLAYTGTYSIGIDPHGTTGAVSVNVNAFSSVTGVLQFDVPSTIAIAYPSQMAKYTFGGVAGQVIDFAETGHTFHSCWITTILNPDGSSLNNGTWCGDSTTGNLTLPMSGTYTVLINPGSQNGSFVATLTKLITEPIVLNNPLAVNSSLAGQVYNLTLSGTVGQIIDLAETGSTFRGCWYTTISNPDGTSNLYTFCGDSTTGNITLPQSGTYTIQIDPGAQAGTTTATLTKLITEPIGLNIPLTVNSSLAGQIYDLTFSGTAGQVLDVAETGSSFRGCWYTTIVNPDGTSNPHTFCGDGTTGNVTLPQTGVYAIQINPGAQAGTTAATLTQLIQEPFGPTTLTFNLPGQMYDLTFNGTVGQVFDLSGTGATFRGCWGFTIVNPDGSTLDGMLGCGSTGDSGNLTLPQQGTYSIYSNMGVQTGMITIQ